MKTYYAEISGTYTQVFSGWKAIIINPESAGVITHPGIAFTFGLIVVVMTYALCPISVVHLEHLWTYLTAPTIGTILAILVWRFIRTESSVA
jgi:glycerol uptake facilitator-like aquaporin